MTALTDDDDLSDRDPPRTDCLLFQNLKRLNWAEWSQSNRVAVDSYNERIEREGLPLERYKTF